VVEQAPVLPQARVPGAGERADQGVGEDHPADSVVTESLLDRLPGRPLDERLPGGIVVHQGTDVRARAQRLGHGRE